MKKISLSIALIIVLFYSCGTPKQSINHREVAIKNYQTGNYQQAVADFKKYIAEEELKGVEPDPRVYNEMAKAYYQSGNLIEAERYYDWALLKNTSDEELLVLMSDHYRNIDNLSKEITALEYYRDHFATGKDSIMVRKSLFEAYMKSENWESAVKTWTVLEEETKNTEKYTQYYFDLNKELENNERCDVLAQKLLEFDENNQQALEWMAKKYYNLGENRYQSSMDAYNKKKTTKNYKILLKELDQVTVDLKKSLNYFNKLWKMEGGKKHATYLANIYTRFDDKQKSQYYKSFIK